MDHLYPQRHSHRALFTQFNAEPQPLLSLSRAYGPLTEPKRRPWEGQHSQTCAIFSDYQQTQMPRAFALAMSGAALRRNHNAKLPRPNSLRPIVVARLTEFFWRRFSHASET